MIVMYVDKDGNAMKMKSEDTEIRLPVLVKEYNRLVHTMVITVNPGLDDYGKMMKIERKQKDGFTFTWLTMTLVGDPKDQFNWTLEGTSQFTGESADMIGPQWISRREAWHKRYCSYWGLTSSQHTCNLGDTFYVSDSALSDIRNCTIHLFGECKIWTKKLSNVLLFIHGTYEEI